MRLRLNDLICFTLMLSACGPTVVPEAESSGTDPSTGAAPTTEVAPTTTSATTSSETTADVSTSTSTTGGTDTSTSETEASFIKPVDAGGGCIGSPFPAAGEFRLSLCDVFAQDCGPGDKCAGALCVDEWATTYCAEVTGSGVAGDPCTAVDGGENGKDDCAFGHRCWNLDAQDQGTCVPLCTGTEQAPVCPGDLECFINFTGVLNLCLPGCDPLVQDCANDELCGESATGFFCMPDLSGDAGASNDPCDAPDACDKGHLCRVSAEASSACDPEAPGCCQPLCSFPDGACPNPDQTCQQYFDPDDGIPPGGEDIGVCGIAK